jgi:hypothetical protein
MSTTSRVRPSRLPCTNDIVAGGAAPAKQVSTDATTPSTPFSSIAFVSNSVTLTAARR